MSAAIEVKDLRFGYGPRGATVLDIPHFVVPRGARVFLHGPSGSGKTTLLGILAGILSPTAGKVSVLGAAFDQMGGHARDLYRGANIGYIFQMFNLIPYLSVLENILLPSEISPERRARTGTAGAAATAAALAERLGIARYLDQPVTMLSVGQQQRVAAARALLGAPGLIIADEPTSALDSDHREAFLKLLFDEAEMAGASVLFVSHDHMLKPLFNTVVSLRDVNRAAAR